MAHICFQIKNLSKDVAYNKSKKTETKVIMKHNTTKMHKEFEGKVPLIPSLNFRWRWVINFIIPNRKNPPYSGGEEAGWPIPVPGIQPTTVNCLLAELSKILLKLGIHNHKHIIFQALLNTAVASLHTPFLCISALHELLTKNIIWQKHMTRKLWKSAMHI
jgi:hypothetical protein